MIQRGMLVHFTDFPVLYLTHVTGRFSMMALAAAKVIKTNTFSMSFSRIVARLGAGLIMLISRDFYRRIRTRKRGLLRLGILLSTCV